MWEWIENLLRGYLKKNRLYVRIKMKFGGVKRDMITKENNAPILLVEEKDKKVENDKPVEKVAQLKLFRKWFTENSTIGELLIEGNFKCFILEDPVRPIKIYGNTAIPSGIYEIIISYSNKFKKYLPLLMNVPNYKGIRIHAGNRPEDTEGCLIPGMEKAKDIVYYSRKATGDLIEILKTMTQHEKVYIEITNEGEPYYGTSRA